MIETGDRTASRAEGVGPAETAGSADEAQELETLEPYLPGDEIFIEPVYFAHAMNVEEVHAAFVCEEGPERRIVLSGTPRREGEQRRGDGIVIKSRVRLEARIPAGALPGTYRCRTVTARTFGGQNVEFDVGPNVRSDWAFRVIEEPGTPPEIRYW